MILHDILKQLVLAGVGIAVSTYLWRTVTNQYTTRVAESIKNQKPIEFKQVEFKPMQFDSKSLIWQPPTINMSDFQPKSSPSSSKSTSASRPTVQSKPMVQSRPSTTRSSTLHKHR